MKIVKERLKRIYDYRQVLLTMAIKELKVKYVNSIFGICWMVINPILIVLSITFVFVVIFQTKIDNFPFFVLTGIFPWMFFSNSLSEATFSILSKRPILRQYNLPLEIIPMSVILSNFLSFAIGLAIIYLCMLFLNFKIILLLHILIIVIILHLFFTLGLGLILSVLNIFYRDVGRILETLLMLWLWVTPVFYSPGMVPQKFRLILNFNPMTYYVVSYREIIFENKLPAFLTFTVTFAWALLSIIFGLLVFSRLEFRVLKRI